MIVCVAVDNKNGLMFNHRRQSQDRVLRSDILEVCRGQKLWIHTYSQSLFDENEQKELIVDDAFLEKAESEDYCYVETNGLREYEGKISKIILYRWNRDYPADVYFEVNLQNGNWEMISTSEFKGSSHDAITKEVWKRVC